MTANIQYLEHLSLLSLGWIYAIFVSKHHEDEIFCVFAFSRMRSSSIAVWLTPYFAASFGSKCRASSVIRNEIGCDFFIVQIVMHNAPHYKLHLIFSGFSHGT